MTTTTTMARVWCELSGFPPAPRLTNGIVQQFLPSWAVPVAVIQEIRNGPPPHRTGSVILTLPSMEDFHGLDLFCLNLPPGTSPVIRLRLLQPRPATTPRTSAGSSHPPTRLPSVTTTTGTNPRTRNETTTTGRNASNPSEATALASQFLTFLHENDHPLLSTRDTIGKAFQSFLQQVDGHVIAGNNDNNTRRLEAMVMARMRQLKWLRSTKRSTGGGGIAAAPIIVVSIVERDRKTFPTTADRNTARQVFIEQQKLAEQDKEGVSLILSCQGQVVPKGSTLHVTLGQMTIVELEMISQEQRSVLVEEIDVRGPQAHFLEPSNAETLSLLASLPTHRSNFRLSYKIQPRSSIGMIRMSIHVALEAESTFSISRSITISFGNPELDAILQPTAPYQRRTRTTAPHRHEQVHWPETATTRPRNNTTARRTTARGSQQQESSRLKTLPKYAIPKDTITLIRNHEMENLLNSLRWSPKTTQATKQPQLSSTNVDNNIDANVNTNATVEDSETPNALLALVSRPNPENYKSRIHDYGKFWSNLLHISEYQSFQDIELFDMKQVPLERRPRSMFALHVPGLAEGRPSVLRGDFVNLSWKNHLYKGRVYTTQLLQVILEVPLKFANSFNPSLDRVDMVRFTLSRTTLRTSHRACLELAQRNLGAAILEPTRAIVQRQREAQLLHQVERTILPAATSVPLSFANRNLNAEQQRAIYQMVHEKGGHTLPYILFGPPGTGKTTVVVETVYQLAMRNKRTGQEKPNILLAAPSNDAADILVARLATYFPPKELMRVVAYSRNKDDLPVDILPYVNQQEEDGEEKLHEILRAKIVVSTVNLAARFVYLGVPKGHFSVICVDEAGHATEPELVAVAASLYDAQFPHSQLILAGDPKQLGPITTSKICESYGLGVSLLERLSQRSVYQRNQETNQYPHDLLTKLVRNYRSHPALLKLPNEMFYDGELVCSADMMMTHSMARWEHLPKPGFPIVFHSIQGENLREANSPSWFNPQEAQQVVAYVNLLLRETKPPLRQEEIGIITPYARQAQKIRAALQVSHPYHEIKVGSVECFQGQERRVIVLSTVRSEPELYLDHDIRYNLGFIAHPKRFNVAMTRAKALLIVIGCPTVLAVDKENWLPFLQYCHDNGAIVGESWDPSSATGDEDDNEEEAGDAIIGNNPRVNHELMQSWDLVQAEEAFAYVNREE